MQNKTTSNKVETTVDDRFHSGRILTVTSWYNGKRFAKLATEAMPHYRWQDRKTAYTFALTDGSILLSVGYGNTAREAYNTAYREQRIQRQMLDTGEQHGPNRPNCRYCSDTGICEEQTWDGWDTYPCCHCAAGDEQAALELADHREMARYAGAIEEAKLETTEAAKFYAGRRDALPDWKPTRMTGGYHSQHADVYAGSAWE